MTTLDRQPDLFHPAAPLTLPAQARRSDPSSSQEAARRVEQRGTATSEGNQIVALLRATPGGLTAYAIDRALFPDNPNVVAPKRLPVLERKGEVYRAAERRANHPGGVGAQVWKYLRGDR